MSDSVERLERRIMKQLRTEQLDQYMGDFKTEIITIFKELNDKNKRLRNKIERLDSKISNLEVNSVIQNDRIVKLEDNMTKIMSYLDKKTDNSDKS